MGRRRTAGAVLAVGALAATLLVQAPASQADPEQRKREVDAGIQDLRSALEGSSAELAAAAAALQQTEERIPVARAELAQAQAVAAEARRQDAELAGRLAAATESEAKATAALDAGQAAIDSTTATIGTIAARAYRGGSVDSGLALALSSQSPADFANRYVMVDTALRSQNGALARLSEQRAVQGHQQARLVAVRAEVDRLKQEAAAAVVRAAEAEATAAAVAAELDRLAVQQREARAVVEARRADEAARLDALEVERQALEVELRRIAEENARRAAEEAEARRRAGVRAAPAAPAPSGGGALAMPVNARISSQYGYRIHPIYKTRRMHAGTDFAAGCGTPVVAAADGSVVRAGTAGGYGNQLVLDHGTVGGESVATSYNHLSGFEVTGGSVSRGQVVAYIGTTGSSTGCHLHFEVYVNGGHTDPMGWL